MTTDPALRKPQILIVDDDEEIRSVAREALEHSGYQVLEAADGHAALDQVAESAVDLVLLDIEMPGIDGFDVCRCLRRLPGGEHVPIVMVTGRGDIDAIRQAYELGVTDFVNKPIQYVVLSHRIRHILRAHKTERVLRRREEQLDKARKIAKFGHYRWDLDLCTLHLSSSAAEILGVDPVEQAWSVDRFLTAIHPEERSLVGDTLAHCLETARPYQLEHRLAGASDRGKVVRHEAEPDVKIAGIPRSLIGIVQDITERRRAEERIHNLAYFDPTTGLPNRTLAREMLRHALVTARRHGHCMALLLCDLDNFKQINDTLGHDAGDQLLKVVAKRLGQCVRGGDVFRLPRPDAGDGDTPLRVPDLVSRVGGDEFVIGLTEVARAEDTVLVVERIRENLAPPIVLAGERISISASIGISIFPQDGEEIEALLSHADGAMYQAKRQGRNSYHFYTEAINARAVRRFTLETALRDALDNEELILHYQPKIDLTAGNVSGVEALVRWQHPDRGLVSPMDFIPVAEETGLIVPMGEWILRTACEQARRWQQNGAPDLSVAVNLSVRQFRQPDLLARMRSILEASGLAPHCLELELTESLLMEDSESCVPVMTGLRETGVTLAIDDFGTGYSSLSYLKRFPIQTLKIDRSFVRDLGRQPDDAVIVEATILLGHKLGLKVVAEGVETREQLAILRSHACDTAQGYLFSRPLAAGDLEAWLNGGRFPVREEIGIDLEPQAVD